jgi:hypothetical protein
VADQYNYIFKFPNQTAAFIDPVIGPYLNTPTRLLTPLWVYDLRQGGVNTLLGYWAIIISDGPDATLANNSHLQFAIDRDASTASANGITGCTINNIPDELLENLQIVMVYGGYIENGLIPPLPPNVITYLGNPVTNNAGKYITI